MVQYQPPRTWRQWVAWLAAGLHGRNRWRLSVIIRTVFGGRRTVTTWLRAVGVIDDFSDYYYFLQPLGRKAKELGSATAPGLLLVRLSVGDRVLFAGSFADQTLWPGRWSEQESITIRRPVRL